MRNASGSKFSLGSAFGRKTERKQSYSGNDFGQPDSPGGPGGYGGFGNNANSNHPTHGHPQGYSHAGNGNTSDDPGSPNVSGAGATFDGFGKKLGKTFAHQSLLPSLGNKDQRALQDVISAEKGVLNSVERLANESSKAAASLPPYGLQEGPDLHDILQQSSVLLTHLSSSMTAFAERQTSLRGCYKRIREREELLSDLRSRRRATGNKAETAEKKLAKMGPENKQLPSQTELLESLRQQMRSIDTEIVNEESKIGDFKRQSVKEALSYKFAGLEELGEKLCIIGELGKLVIEEIPLDETPAGYGRAPYNGFAKTESAVDEAGRCLSQVKFNPATFELKPSHLPRTSHTLGRETLPAQETLAAAEEYGHVPPPAGGPGGIGGYDNRSQPPGVGPNGASGPHVQGQGQGNGNGNRVGFALDDNPYGGLDGRYTSDNHAYREYGGTRSDDPNAPGNSGPGGNQVVWQGPTEEALARQNQTHSQLPHTQGRGQGYDDRKPSLGPVASTIPHTQNAGEGADGQVHDYEYEQQAEMDRQHREEEAAWQEQARAQDAAQQQQGGHSRELAIGEVMHNPYDAPYAGGGGGGKTQPLNIRRGERGQSPAAQNTPLPAPGVYVNAHSNTNANEGEYNYGSEAHHTGGYDNNAPSQALQESPAAITALAPPPSFAQMGRASPSIGDSGTEGFRTPAESPAMLSSDHVGGLGAPQHSSDQHQVGGGDGPSGVPVIALAPEQEFGVGGGDGSAQRGSSPLPPVPGISDIPPAGRGPSPRPLPEPGIGVAAPPQAGYASAIPPPSPSASTAAYSPTGPTGGKISAGAFRKAQPRRSDLGAAPITAGGLDDGPQGVGSGFGGGEGSRRLPVPPGQPGTQGAPQLNAQGWADEKKALGEQIQAQQREQEQRGAFEDAPPGYSRGEDSLR